MMRALTVFALLSAVPLASANMVEISWDKDGRFAHTTTINPGSMAEICGGLNKDTAVDWSFEASGSLDFNIHYHVKGGAEYPAKLSNVTKAHDKLMVQLDHGYCWMWENKGMTPANLRLELQKNP